MPTTGYSCFPPGFPFTYSCAYCSESRVALLKMLLSVYHKINYKVAVRKRSKLHRGRTRYSEEPKRQFRDAINRYESLQLLRVEPWWSSECPLAREWSEPYVWTGKASHMGRINSSFSIEMLFFFAKSLNRRSRVSLKLVWNRRLLLTSAGESLLRPLCYCSRAVRGTVYSGVASCDGGRGSVLCITLFLYFNLLAEISWHVHNFQVFSAQFTAVAIESNFLATSLLLTAF